MNYERIKGYPKQFVSVTGLTIAQFDVLLESFKLEWLLFLKK
jgi:hypothetical protein